MSQQDNGVVTSLFQQPSPVTGRLVLPQRQRNIYTEFLAEQHCCAPLAGLSSVTKMSPFQVPTVHELLQLAQQQAEMEQNWARHSSFTSSDPSNALCWTYMVLQPEHFNPPLLLVSQLTCSRHSGELQLEDNTGRVACVISQSTEAPSYPHLCTNACQSSGKPLVLVNSCPFVHPWNLNWLIRVDRYQLVVERFMHAKNENLASDQSDHKDFMTGCYIRISVQFSMCDVVNLYKVKRAGRLKHGPGVKMLDQVSGNTAGDLPTKKCEIDNPNSHRKRKGLEVSKSCKVACEDPTDQSARIYTAKDQSASHREDVCSAPRTDPISSKHQFPLCQPSSSSDNKRDDQAAPQGLELQNQQYVCQNFFLVHKDYPVVQQSADRKVTQGFYSSGLFLGNAVVGENSLRQQHDVNAGEGRNMMEAIKEVAVLFTGDAVQWYTVMHEGCLYRLVCPDSTDPAVFATKVSSAALNRAVDATNCRTCVVLPTGVFVEVLSEHRKDLCASSSSSVRVEALSHRDMKESITTGPSAPTSLDNLQNIPKVFLGQLINSEARQQVMVKVVCQVVCIRYLYMQYTCSSCGQIFSNGQCQNRPCTSSSSDPGHFTAKASFLVDDGTGTAHVHCQQDVIGGVLGLTDDHWNILKRQAQKKGRLALRESGWGNNEWVADGDGCESPVESLLTSLCESLLVRRHVQLYCQITSTVHSSNSNSGKDYPVVTLEVGGVQYLTHIHPAVHLCCLKSVG
ncbi:CST complex subunit ctc1 [Branchiostoma belcheri]|nr:CST complex subunit ctc1 [Branchiostoma belcheri]